MKKAALVLIAFLLPAAVAFSLPPNHNSCRLGCQAAYVAHWQGWYNLLECDQYEGPIDGPSGYYPGSQDWQDCMGEAQDYGNLAGAVCYEDCVGNAVGGCTPSNPWCGV